MRLLSLAGVLLVGAFFISCDPSTVIEAQSLPATVHAQWTPNVPADNVTGYVVVLDGGTPQAVPLSACTATTCTAAVLVPTVGAHAVTVAAQNLALSADPTSVQTGSPSAPVSFTLNLAPGKVTGATVGK